MLHLELRLYEQHNTGINRGRGSSEQRLHSPDTLGGPGGPLHYFPALGNLINRVMTFKSSDQRLHKGRLGITGSNSLWARCLWLWPTESKRIRLTFLVLGEAAEGQHEDHSEDTGHLVLHGSFTGRPRVTDEPLPEFLDLYRQPICRE